MKHSSVLLLGGLAIALASCVNQPAHHPTDEPFRSVYHHTPDANWMNDPNGMFYDEANGIWHLYYQYYPEGTVWGPMHWGHSTSQDLIHWDHQPIAIYPDENGMIFSGSAVIDKNNTAGFGENAIVAIYTSADKAQNQSISYSLDGGQTFTAYEESYVATPKMQVADTVGAGDSFTATFVTQLLLGKTIREAHEKAVAVSAYVCTQRGAMPVLPENLK